MVMRYAKLCNHSVAAHHEIGIAISNAIHINPRKSFESIATTLLTDAPITFLMPISFCLFCAVNAARPNKPRQEIRTAMPAKYFDKAAIRSSDAYKAW